MLSTIELEGYRGFKRYRLKGLSRVNLLVGKNNCGKTSILEAVHLLASGADPAVLASTAWQRGEVMVVPEREGYRQRTFPVIAHFFHGHEFGPDAQFFVSSGDGLGRVAVRVVILDESERPGETSRQRSMFPEPEDLASEEALARPTLGISLETSTHSGGHTLRLPVTDEGALFPDLLPRYRPVRRWESRETPPVQFITPDSLEPRSMSEMWNKVITEGRESEVIEAMRILAPGLKGIFFLSGDSALRFGARGGVLAAFETGRRREPLGSHGDGMRRLLALSLSLIRSEDGLLLVDEVDTGLHYSVMGDMWRLLVEAARRSNVQVFATTHSSDCVHGLAWLCENHADLRQEVSVQKIEADLRQSVALDADEIMLAVSQGMEVR